MSQAQGDDVTWLLNQINCLRQNLGVAPLTLNTSLMTSARQHSTYLANNRITDYHVEPDGSTPLTRATAAGYKGYVGENVVGWSSLQGAFEWWKGDDIHYKNMTSPYWSEIGIGIVSGTYGTWYTTDFGTTSWKLRQISVAPCGGSNPPPMTSATSANPNPAPITNQPTTALKQPDYVVGLDEHGNIKHQVRPGDTVSSIAYLYGYAWDDIPKLLALNNMANSGSHMLKAGTIFLVPPKNGTFTPTPGATPLDATVTGFPALASTSQPAASTAAYNVQASVTNSPTFTSTMKPTSTITATAISISMLGTIATLPPQPVENPQPPSPNPIHDLVPWLILINGIVIGGLILRPLLQRHR